MWIDIEKTYYPALSCNTGNYHRLFPGERRIGSIYILAEKSGLMAALSQSIHLELI